MSLSARIAALVAIGALVLAGLLAIANVGGRGGPLPSIAPSPSSIPSAASSPATSALSETFASPTYGYTVRTPAGWSVKPATRLWSTGDRNGWNTGFNDELYLASAGQRFSGASQRLAEGQSGEDWLNSYAGGDTRTGWTSITIGGETGYVANNGLDAAGRIAPGIARAFAAVVISGDRAYNFLMDGKVDRATFDAFLATITLDPASVGALPPLDDTFTSRFYGYSIKRSADWTVTPATAHWQGVDNSPPATDEIVITGTDTTVTVASQALGAQSLNQFLVPFHASTTANVPPGCDGGDPATWASTPIGSETGRWYELCNAAEAVVEVGGRVYVFTWSNSTFEVGDHLGIPSWLKLLETVTFDPAAAVDN